MTNYVKLNNEAIIWNFIEEGMQFLTYLAAWVTRVKTKMRALCQLMHTHENNVGICEELKSCKSYPIES